MIEVTNLTKTFDTVEALRAVSFHIPPGQVCGFLGPNGAGKSTTVKILVGILKPTSGKAVVAGYSVEEQPLEVKKRIGYVPELGTVYSTLSGNEYLALVGALHDMSPEQVADRSHQLLKLFNIADQGNRRLDTLSKGMRQKVVLSAALLHDPEVILMDEPLSGLDANAAHTVKDLVRGLADQGKTVLYCSHVLDVVQRLCERVIIVNHGTIVADGETQTLLQSAHRRDLESLFRSLTATDDDQAAVQEFLKSFEGERAHPKKSPASRPNKASR